MVQYWLIFWFHESLKIVNLKCSIFAIELLLGLISCYSNQIRLSSISSFVISGKDIFHFSSLWPHTAPRHSSIWYLERNLSFFFKAWFLPVALPILDSFSRKKTTRFSIFCPLRKLRGCFSCRKNWFRKESDLFN